MPRPKLLQPLAVALLGGGLWGYCAGVTVHPWLATVALVPLLWLAQQERGWIYSFLFGLSSWCVAIPWIADTVSVYGGLPTVLGYGTTVLLGSILAIYSMLFAMGTRHLLRQPRWALLSVPSLWVLLEVLRGILLSGFPWNQAGYLWIEVPGALEWSARSGAWGVSFLIVGVNVAAWSAWRERQGSIWISVVLAVAILLAINARLPVRTEAGQTLAVHLLQPNTQIYQDPNAEEVQKAYQALFALTREVCKTPALVLWPESAAWPWAVGRDEGFRADLENLAEAGCAVLVNSPRWQEDKVYNSAYLVTGRDRLQFTDKRHLVPFGEYIPLASVLPFADSLARSVGNFSSTDSPTLLDWQSERIGVSICYEVVFAREVADLTAQGATVLATITNDAWYGDTSAPHQHLRAARFRAAENGRPMLRAALTGISAVIDERGHLEQELGVNVAGVLSSTITSRIGKTPFTRLPWATPIAALMLLASAIFGLRRNSFRRP